MIKNKFKLVSLLAALLIVGGVMTLSAFAVTTFDAATNVTLTSPSATLTVDATSVTVDGTFVVNDGNIQFQVPASSTFAVRSATNRLQHSGSAGVTVGEGCLSGGTSTLSFTTGGSASGTITVTPASAACSVGGGGGGSGGGVSDTTPPTGSVVINGGAATTSTVNVTLALNANDANGVSSMQVSNDANFAGAVWENFSTSSKAWTLTSGDGTKTVYAKFRDPAGNVSATVSDSITLSGSGTVPPPSPVPPTPPAPPAPVPPGSQAAVIAQLQAQINALILQINALIAAQGGTRPAECTAPLTRQLNFGLRHREVTCLQAYLRANGYMTVSPTGFFGALTRTAIQRFQAEKGIAVQGNAGFGIVGPKTRASINAALGF